MHYSYQIEEFFIKKGLRGIQLDKAKAAIVLAFGDDMVLMSKYPIHQKYY